MATFKAFEDIDAWQKARDLVRRVYHISRESEFSRDYALKDQMRRAAISIMSNIAEGFERNGNKEFIHFLSIAKGSAGEVRSQLYVALDQRYIDKAEFDSLIDLLNEISRLTGGLMSYLKTSGRRGSKFPRNPLTPNS